MADRAGVIVNGRMDITVSCRRGDSYRTAGENTHSATTDRLSYATTNAWRYELSIVALAPPMALRQLLRTKTCKDRPDRLHHDQNIEPERKISDVIEIELELFLRCLHFGNVALMDCRPP